MTTFKTLDDLDVAGKRVLVRVDLNVPMKDGKVTDTTRIDRAVPTLTELSDKGGAGDRVGAFRAAEGQGGPRNDPGPGGRGTGNRLGGGRSLSRAIASGPRRHGPSPG